MPSLKNEKNRLEIVEDKIGKIKEILERIYVRELKKYIMQPPLSRENVELLKQKLKGVL